ncbi:MAG: DNA translocase FtsK 4TM domain-containing protein [bacterium]
MPRSDPDDKQTAAAKTSAKDAAKGAQKGATKGAPEDSVRPAAKTPSATTGAAGKTPPARSHTNASITTKGTARGAGKGKGNAPARGPTAQAARPNAESSVFGLSRRTGEFLGILQMALSLLALAALMSLQFGAGALMGPFGRMLALSLYALLGLGSYLVVLAVAFIGLRTLIGHSAIRWSIWAGYLGATLCGSILFHCLFPDYTVYGFTAGGKGGEILGEVLVALFSTAGTYLVTGVGMLLCLLVATEASLITALIGVGRAINGIFSGLGRGFRSLWASLRRLFTWQVASSEAAQSDGTLALSPPAAAEAVEDVLTIEAELPEPIPALAPDKPTPAKPERASKEPAGPKIVESEFRKLADGQHPLGTVIPLGDGDVSLPELSLLDTPQLEGKEIDREAMQRRAVRLGKALRNYGIQGEVTEIHPGPVVTLYEFRPAPGTKISKIVTLDRDLAMTLESTRVRIVAPIPGKGTIGIEVPNNQRETVFLQELLADPAFTKAKSLLTIALGKDISGRPTVCNLAKAPHLLVAGSTGSGKSVGINTMLMSLLYRATPDQVRLILIDPKMLEFSTYEGIPHLLLPVVTDPKSANQALRWAVNEMERRYQLMAEAGVRDVKAYNHKIKQQLELAQKVLKETPAPDDRPKPPARPACPGSSGTTSVVPPRAPENAPPLEELPFIVIVIDEFADLMMVAPKDVETSVARIAQKARAAGLHLIVATQRPSKDVITGLIKANFPTRIAFQVSSKIDSRVILDRNGAESLLGMGDMLFLGAGQSPERMHGAFVSTSEVQRVVEFLKSQARPVYNMDILKPDDPSEDEAGEEEYDEFYDQAVHLVTTSRRASTSWIQRQLRVGYNRAARMLEIMEREGIVGAQERGARNREVLAPPPPED